MVPPVSINWPFFSRSLATVWPFVFVPLAVADAIASFAAGWLGTDAHLYYRASAAWLGGGNPWEVFVANQGHVYHYYALPTATVALAPFTILPENIFVTAWIVLQLGAAIYAVRRLRLPWWWVAFPPLVNGILAGNPSPLLIALLVATHPMAKAIAVLLKVYAVVPLIGERRWRAILIAGVLGSVTVAVAPMLWMEFLHGTGGRADTLLIESKGGYSAFGNPVLMVGAGAALLLIARHDIRAAGWLAPIALWPGSQFHWSTLAMPVMTLTLGYLLAFPGHGLPPIAVMVYAAIAEVRHYRTRRREATGAGVQPSD
jgi:hypothetical protein